MKKIYYLMMIAAVALFAACENDDTNFDDIIGGGGNNEPEYVPRTVEFDDTPLQEPEESFSYDDNDYVENNTFFYTVYVDYDGNNVTLDGDDGLVDISVDGAHVTVNSTVRNVEYVLSGSSDNGSFKIYSEMKMKITLDGLNLTNPRGAAINNQCGKTLYMELAEGKTNRLTDGTVYDMVVGEDMKATLFSEGQIVFSGAGKLEVTANSKNAIASDDYIIFRPGNVIDVTGNAGNGVKANDGIDIRGGVLNVNILSKAGKGLNCEQNINVSGGRTTIITSGGPEMGLEDTSSCAAIKSDLTFTMTAGELNLKSTGEGGKGINSDEDIIVNGGKLTVVTLGKKDLTSPKGLKADRNITFGGGDIYSYSANADAVDAVAEFTYVPGYVLLTNEKHLFEVKYE
ncbi:MAG: carbohydrate-binding domain-containing protein [Prevotella sp.]